jgi:hypothetical protein
VDDDEGNGYDVNLATSGGKLSVNRSSLKASTLVTYYIIIIIASPLTCPADRLSKWLEIRRRIQ